MRKLLKPLLVLLAGALLILTGCSQQGNASAAKKITYVTSTDFYAEPAAAVLGSHGKAEPIIHSTSVDPHDFQPTTADGKVVAGANVVLVNGLGYDHWLNKLAANSSAKLLTVASIVGAKNGDNEHLWYRPETMSKVADALVKEFSKLQPQNKKDFQANAAKYKKELAKLTPLINAKKTTNNGAVAVTEPVFGNMLDALGYKVMDNAFANATEDGNDPSTAVYAKVEKAIKDKSIKFFVVNTQTTSKVITQLTKLAEQNKVPVVRVTETKPKGLDYVQWMSKQLKEIPASASK
ncbi:metal ABC transporter solute-binding protein, Zn/Mn family [Schleiferilactobacillus shenzhenensis]|uniref:metal ABC transporter solute-binding protein, Zn/Mn family n=1 Tax=Schleiferilactobacillus shenzhenensis TaxID=1231337 RepID=UPI00041B011F|nr:zinc ABC transporter substrate-binding protein [Schleiferilactobacillus shenzhenensis]